MDLARAPRRAARKKGSGYENDCWIVLPEVESFIEILNLSLTFPSIVAPGPCLNRNTVSSCHFSFHFTFIILFSAVSLYNI